MKDAATSLPHFNLFIATFYDIFPSISIFVLQALRKYVNANRANPKQLALERVENIADLVLISAVMQQLS
jgi:hypothetical protein